ncbi:hypothetical protein Pint_24319 [Pistacia integerrima]|uniref:Uncharacterized protein n=1 Tax=Pistacia integerrima TaxID=434235 RepID=A0ACC0YFZ0_9ROSI|nr:hypothetical protein Pint_24319 [Pistacia integerrima]
MKILLVLFVAFLLIMASPPADAKRITLEEKNKKMVERQPLLSEKYESSRCRVTDAKDAERLTATSDDDDTNPTYKNYGNPSGSSREADDNYHHLSDFIPAATITSSSSSSSSSVAAALPEGAKVAAPPRAPAYRVIAGISTMMKTSVVFFVAFLLVLAILQADAKRHTLEEKHKLMVSDERQLLSETNTGSRIANTGAADDDNEANPTKNKYGNPTGSSSDSHHYYTNDQQPKN